MTIGAAQSAAVVAATINDAASASGVTARARTMLRLWEFSRAGPIRFQLRGDPMGGQNSAPAVTIQTHLEQTDDLTSLVAVINEKSATTGIIARFDQEKGSMLLVAEDGRDIAIGDVTGTNILVQGLGVEKIGTTLGDAGNRVLLIGDTNNPLYQNGTLDSTRVGGFLRFESALGPFVVRSSDANASSITGNTDDSRLDSIAAIDLRTADGAASALAVLDGSIQRVSLLRASLGALQNQRAATVDQLATTSVNLESARSRIVDADVAEQAAVLARSQIVRDAGASMLAQANQRARIALKLLG